MDDSCGNLILWDYKVDFNIKYSIEKKEKLIINFFISECML